MKEKSFKRILKSSKVKSEGPESTLKSRISNPSRFQGKSFQSRNTKKEKFKTFLCFPLSALVFRGTDQYFTTTEIHKAACKV